MQSLGYDGLIDNLYGQYAAFEPNQIKSATGNVGDFDLNSSNITKAKGGSVKSRLAQKKTNGYATGGLVAKYNPNEIDEIANMVREGIYG